MSRTALFSAVAGAAHRPGGPRDRFVRARSGPDGGTCAGEHGRRARRADAGAQPPGRRGQRAVQDARHSRRHAHRRHRRSSAGSGRHRRSGNRIASVRSAGTPGLALRTNRAPQNADLEVDATGHVPDAGIRRHARARRRRAEERTTPSTPTSCGWRTASRPSAACRSAATA